MDEGGVQKKQGPAKYIEIVCLYVQNQAGNNKTWYTNEAIPSFYH